MLRVDDRITFIAPPIEETGIIRYAPSFRVNVLDVALVGYAPRFAIDDETGFLILADFDEQIYYFNLDTEETAQYRKIETLFGFSLQEVRHYSDEERHSGLAEAVYPPVLKGKSLFKPWSLWFPTGVMKRIGYKLSMDNPKWERLSDEVKEYIRTEKEKRTA
jgi:hypothetical protein